MKALRALVKLPFDSKCGSYQAESAWSDAQRALKTGDEFEDLDIQLKAVIKRSTHLDCFLAVESRKKYTKSTSFLENIELSAWAISTKGVLEHGLGNPVSVSWTDSFGITRRHSDFSGYLSFTDFFGYGSDFAAIKDDLDSLCVNGTTKSYTDKFVVEAVFEDCMLFQHLASGLHFFATDSYYKKANEGLGKYVFTIIEKAPDPKTSFELYAPFDV